MLSGESIVCFSLNNWFGIWRNRQHIMSRLALKNHVIYVNPGCTLIRALILLFTLKFYLRHRIIQDHGVYVFMPPTYLVRFPIIQSIDRWLKQCRNRLLMVEMKKMGFGHPILWLARPDEVKAIEYFRPKLVCYHVVDEYAAYMELPPERVRSMEEDTAKRAALVIVVSQSLLERKRLWNNNIYLIPNGVDQGFLKWEDDVTETLQDLKGMGRPIIGYIGAINLKVDLELITYLARARPEWQILLVGPIHLRTLWDDFYRRLRRLKQMQNVHFLGEKTRDKVIEYFRAIDVGIMPYKLDIQGMNLSPIKLFEYLACGKPCVSVDVPSVREYGGVIKIAKTYAEFVDMVEQGLKENSSELEAGRRYVAMENTWEKRVDEISSLLVKALEGCTGK